MSRRNAGNRGTVRSLLAAGLACLISGLAVVFAMLIPSASAITAGDDEHGEDKVTCEQLGLKPLEDHTFTATLSEDEKTLDVDAKEGFVIDAVILKGRYATEVFYDEPFHGLQLPLNKYGKTPKIHDYEVCGCPKKTETPKPTETTHTPKPTPTTPTEEPTTPTEEPTTPTEEPTTPTEKPTTPTEKPTTPAVTPTVPAQPELPETGSTNGWLAAAGAALLAAGTGLVLLGRRAGRHEA